MDSTLTVEWGTPETELGRTVYRLVGVDRVEVEDFVRKGDAWRSFGRASYNRLVDP
jgi:hypothetical protein